MKTNGSYGFNKKEGARKKGNMGFQRGYQVLNDLINTFAEGAGPNPMR